MRIRIPKLHLLALLGCVGLALPAAVAAQDDDPHHPRGRRSRCQEDCGGLREVSGNAGRNRRDGFFFSAGIGAGAESFDARDGLGWSDGKGGGTGYLKVGGTVGRSVVLGAEAQGWFSSYRGQNYDRTLGNLLGFAQFYPSSSGFWMRGGIGWARDHLTTFNSSGIGYGSSINGTGWALGVGFDVPVGRRVSITPSLDLMGQDYRTHEERVLSLGVGITLP